MDRDQLREIKNNITFMRSRFLLTMRLAFRALTSYGKRKQDISLPEYENYWERCWESRDLYRTDLTFCNNGIPVDGMSPLEFKKYCIVERLSEKIRKHNLSSVLEIGSGAGLNLLFLASRFPDVNFYGLEPTASGVRLTRNLAKAPPVDFLAKSKQSEIKNINVVQGSVLDPAKITELKSKARFDFVFTSAVLEQLNNYRDKVFENVFSLSDSYFLFYEEWLEANLKMSHYRTLVLSDYFRASWKILDRYQNIETLERIIEPMQPSWLQYATVFVRKKTVSDLGEGHQHHFEETRSEES